MTRRRIVLGLVVAAILAASGGAYLLVGTRGATPTTALPAPHFVEQTSAAGVDQVYDGDFTFYVGGGVAVFDCNGDRKPDAFIAGGTNAAGLYRNDSPIGGALRFTRLHDAQTDLTAVSGAYALDIDSDGITDLAVLRVGESVLLRGLGDCRFERASDRWSFDPGRRWNAAFSATWEGAAAFPTLALGSYLGLDAAGNDTTTCDASQLFRPVAGGYGKSLNLAPGYCPLSMLFSDWDRSGRRDLRVSNDSHYYDQVNGQEQLWRMEPGVAPRLYTADEGWVQMQIEGMGIASQDVTGDGYPEVFLTTQGANRLQTLTAGPSKPTYRDIGTKMGANATRPFAGGDPLPSTAWHDEFEDVNNDGFADLFIAKGNVEAEAGYATKDPSNLLLGQAGGSFVESAEQAGILSYSRGRGAALADFNLDGLLDLIEVNRRENVKLWRNVGSGDAAHPAAMGNWLGIQLRQPAPNVDAIGAWIEVRVGDRTLTKEVTVGGGHAGGQLGWIHFGIGPAPAADVRVQWPTGSWGPWQRVGADQFGIIERGASEVQVWRP